MDRVKVRRWGCGADLGVMRATISELTGRCDLT